MLAAKKWLQRSAVVATGATLLVGAATTAAFADITTTLTTTGASGLEKNYHDAIQGTPYVPSWADMYVTDTLADGHCARWQRTTNDGSSWSWFGTQSCGGQVYAGKMEGKAHYAYRVCRTGVGNCSRAYELP
jgi:hypothetical protein